MSSKPINMGRGLLSKEPYSYYTVPAGKIAILQEIVFSSNGAESEFSVWIVPAGSQVNDANRIQRSVDLYSREARYLTLATVMNAGDQLVMSADKGNLSFIASGLEVSA